MTAHPYPGKFIVLDGIDGSGKTTLIPMLADEIRTIYDVDVIEVRDPGTTEIGLKLRSIVLEGGLTNPVSELLLFLAARNELIHQVIKPALMAGQVVLCDRFYVSTYVYQGILKDQFLALRAMSPYIGDSITPNMTYILSLPIETSIQRIESRMEAQNHFDQIDIAQKTKIKEAYDAYALCHERTKLIDADRTLDAILDDIIRHYHANVN